MRPFHIGCGGGAANHRARESLKSYDLNVWSEKKRLEKLNYMQGNPVKRGLVASPGRWAWSSFRFYYLGDTSVLAMDHLP